MIEYKIDEKNKVIIARIIDNNYEIKQNIFKKFMKNYNRLLSSNDIDDSEIKYINMMLKDNRIKNYYNLMRTSIIALSSIIVTEDKKIFKGIARCMDEDKFDIETGKKIARNKLINKMNLYYSNKIKYLYYLLFLFNSNLEDYLNQEEGKITADIMKEYWDEDDIEDKISDSKLEE